ncbi:MAG: glutamate--tRNA ligase [Alphaproteobacteria bacterium]|nr:glutamate--tRNA ligase [Alphaproteobacteria bacterium]
MTQKIADLLFPSLPFTTEEVLAKYPSRDLPQGAQVLRVAPSPTGFMHIGGIYAALVSERVAHQSQGVFMLRIEDTDLKREKEGAVELIASSLEEYSIPMDEGVKGDLTEIGAYGPYTQSKRRDIYQAFVKQMVAEDKAYPCFCSEEDITALREKEIALGARPGYHGQFATCRYLTEAQQEEKIKKGLPWVIRFKSNGNYNEKCIARDILRGNREFPQNDLDIVLLKSDGLPTYHFAHIVDDHLMGTTIVLRGDEWFSSLPLHFQLFDAMGWKTPKYAHIAPIQKMEEGAKRKLSKRKDPEASITFYAEQGYPKQSVLEYLMNLANSNFEDWRRQNPVSPLTDFPFKLKKMGSAGALFDFVKLLSVSRDTVAHMSAERVYEEGLEWAEKYDNAFALLMKENKEKMIKILSIERKPSGKGRKDIALWSDIKKEVSCFFDALWEGISEEGTAFLLEHKEAKEIALSYQKIYSSADDNQVWFDKVKQIADEFNYATSMKDYKEHPENFKGSVSDIASLIRVLITGKLQSPDLHDMMQILGEDAVQKRLSAL